MHYAQESVALLTSPNRDVFVIAKRGFTCIDIHSVSSKWTFGLTDLCNSNMILRQPVLCCLIRLQTTAVCGGNINLFQETIFIRHKLSVTCLSGTSMQSKAIRDNSHTLSFIILRLG